MSNNMWSILIRLKRPPCIAAQKHCGQVKPLLQFEILSARFPNRRVRPASLNPEQKGCRELFPIHSVTALRNAFCRTEPDDDASAVPLDSGLAQAGGTHAGCVCSRHR